MSTKIKKVYVYIHDKLCPVCNGKGAFHAIVQNSIEEYFSIGYIDRGDNGIVGPGYMSCGNNILETEGAHCKFCKVKFQISPPIEVRREIIKKLQENIIVMKEDTETVFPQELFENYAKNFYKEKSAEFDALVMDLKQEVRPIIIKKGEPIVLRNHLSNFGGQELADMIIKRFSRNDELIEKIKPQALWMLNCSDRGNNYQVIRYDRNLHIVHKSSYLDYLDDRIQFPDLWPKNIVYKEIPVLTIKDFE